MPLKIVSLGTALPAHRMSQADALLMTDALICRNDRERRLARVMFAKAGVDGRHTAVPHNIAYEWAAQRDLSSWQGPTTGERMDLIEQCAPRIASEAAQTALDQADVTAADVTHLVTVSCTNFAAPGTDIALFDSLGLRPTVERVNVGFMGCHGAINAIRVASGLVESTDRAVVLLSATELCALHGRFTWDDEGILGNALFGDGSAALVGVNGSGFEPAGRSTSHWTVVATGSCLLPDSRDAMTWRIGDHGFEMRLTSDIPRHIEKHLRPWMSHWLDQQGLAIEDVTHWVIHPGGPRILLAVEQALSLSHHQTRHSHELLNDVGNMSSPTILFLLERLEAESPTGTCVMLGFGPGLAAEVCLLNRPGQSLPG